MTTIDQTSARPARGQVLVVFALVAVSLLSVAGLVIDGINLYWAQRAVQSAADIAALAGALELPDDDDAEDSAIANARRNGYRDNGSTEVDARAPYGGDDRRIEVEISRQVSTYFLPLIGVRRLTVEARAVALNPPRAYALFAGYKGCSPFAGGALGNNVEEAIHWGGSGAAVIGDVHSNAGIKISGSNNTIDGHVSYHCSKRFVNSGSDNTFESGPDRTTQKSWPATYDAASLGCTFVIDDGTDIGSDEGPWWQSGGKASKRLKDGTYCVLGEMKLSGSDISGRVTLIAFGAEGKLNISGSNLRLTPFAQGVLALSQGTGDDAIYMSGSGGRWDGVIYVPDGRAHISGSSNLSVQGSILADTIKLSGSDWSLAAPGAGAPGPHLVE